MAAIRAIAAISKAEREALSRQRIRTTDDLWRHIGPDYDAGMDALANRAQITRKRLTEILAECFIYAEKHRGGVFRPSLASIIGTLIVLFILGLAARAVGLINLPGTPLALSHDVVIASVDLKKGDTIRTADVMTGSLPMQPDYFTSPDVLQDLVLANDVAKGRPLRRGDVLSAQVVASANIPAGKIIASDMITLTWSAYSVGVLSQTVAVEGHAAASNIKSGQPIRADSIQGLPGSASQVLATSAQVLLPFQPIRQDAVTLRDLPPNPYAFTDVKSITKYVPVQQIPAGAVIRSDQLVEASKLAGRVLLSLGVPSSNLPAVSTPTTVTLVFSPTNAGDAITMIRDVELLRVSDGENTTALLVAVTESDRDTIAKLLGKATLLVVVPAVPTATPTT